jgi:hypothetical protein
MHLHFREEMTMLWFEEEKTKKTKLTEKYNIKRGV